MKRIMTFIFSIFLLVSGLIYINIKVFESSTSDIVTSAGADEFVEKVNEMTTFDPILETIPLEYQNDAKRVIDKAMKNKKVDNTITKQSGLIIDDVLNNTRSFEPDALTNDVFDVFDDVAQEIEEITEHAVPKEKLKTQFETKLVGYDLKSYYDQVINKAHNSLSPKQKSFLEGIRFLSNNINLYKTLSLGILIVSIILLMVLSLKTFVSMAIIGFVLVLLNKIMLPWDFSAMTQKALGKSLVLNVDEKIFNLVWSTLGGMFVLGIMGKLFGSKPKKS